MRMSLGRVKQEITILFFDMPMWMSCWNGLHSNVLQSLSCSLFGCMVEGTHVHFHGL